MSSKNNNDDYIKILFVFTLGFNLLSYLFKVPLLSYIGTGIGVVGMMFPFIGRLFSDLWMKFAHILGKINGSILLSIVFFIFLFPIALLQRLISNKDLLKLKPPKDSNFTTRDKTYQKDDLENMW